MLHSIMVVDFRGSDPQADVGAFNADVCKGNFVAGHSFMRLRTS